MPENQAKRILHFKIQNKISIANIQKFAKIVITLIKGFPCPYKEKDLEFIIQQIEDINNYGELKNLCEQHNKDCKFYISTTQYRNILYNIQNNTLLSLESNIYMDKMNNVFFNLIQEEQDIKQVYKDVNILCNLYITINNYIWPYIFNIIDSHKQFDWMTNYRPCFIDLEKMNNIKEPIELISIDKKDIEE